MELVDRLGLQAAFKHAKKSYDEGGVPIGAALVYHGTQGEGPRILGTGHNRRVQKSSATLHGEIAALEAAGRQKAEIYRASTMVTTLSPCSMCTGAILLYRIPRVVIGENDNFKGEEEHLRKNGVEVVGVGDEECKKLMRQFIEEKPESGTRI